jgi:hypothetical protein
MSHQSNDSAVAIGCFLLTMVMVIIFWLATAAAAQAPLQTPCGPTKQMADMLKANFGETPSIAGLANGNTPVLIFTNPKTGTFSITIRRPGGITCLITAGESWTFVDQPKEGIDL